MKQLVVIMGPGRTGKSTLAKHVGSQFRAMWFSTDSLIWMLHRAAPELKVPNDGFNPEEKSAGVQPYLFGFLENTTYNHGLTIAEGDAILPKQLPMLDERFGVVATIALVNTAPEPEKLVIGGGWASHLTPVELQSAAEWLGRYSASFLQECRAWDVPAVDLASEPHEDRIQEAATLLSEQITRSL